MHGANDARFAGTIGEGRAQSECADSGAGEHVQQHATAGKLLENLGLLTYVQLRGEHTRACGPHKKFSLLLFNY